MLAGGLGAAAVAAPFLMGGDEEEVEEESFTGPISSVESIRDQARHTMVTLQTHYIYAP